MKTNFNVNNLIIIFNIGENIQHNIRIKYELNM